MNELLIQQFEQNYYNYSKEIRNMLLKLDTESLIAKLARDSKMYQLKQIVYQGGKYGRTELIGQDQLS